MNRCKYCKKPVAELGRQVVHFECWFAYVKELRQPIRSWIRKKLFDWFDWT